MSINLNQDWQNIRADLLKIIGETVPFSAKLRPAL